MENLIFWYTGVVIWCIIGLLAFILTIVAVLAAVYKVYVVSKYWKGFRLLLNVPIEDSPEWWISKTALFKANQAAGVSFTQEQWKVWLFTLHKEYTDRIKDA